MQRIIKERYHRFQGLVRVAVARNEVSDGFGVRLHPLLHKRARQLRDVAQLVAFEPVVPALAHLGLTRLQRR